MTQQYYIEMLPCDGTIPDGLVTELLELRAREAVRQQEKRDATHREIITIQSTIAWLCEAVSIVESNIAGEFEKSWIKDPKHFLFPIAARALTARRDNLKSTIESLMVRLERLSLASV
jgi:hypothetical protein